jgi:hypothetical protein
LPTSSPREDDADGPDVVTVGELDDEGDEECT